MEPNVNEQEQQSDTPAPEQAGLEKSTIAEQQPAPVEQHVESESESQPAPGTGYTLEMPGDIPMSAHETWQPVLDGFASAASAAGVPRSTAEQLVQGFVDADIAISTKWEANEQYYGWEDAEREMHTIYRDKAQAKIEAAQKMVRKLGLGAFMDGPGNLGNSPSVLAVLAEWHDIGKLSRADAQAELNRLMSDPRGDYFSLDNHRRVPAVLRVQLLSRIANSEPAKRRMISHVEARQRAEQAGVARVEKEQLALKQEAAALVPKLHRGTPAEKEAAKKKFMEISVRLSK